MARIAVRFGIDTIVLTGGVAGILFAVFEMLAAAFLIGPEAATMPLRMIAALVMGEATLDPAYSLEAAAMTGMAVHLVLSIVLTAMFAAIVIYLPHSELPTRAE